MPSAPTTPPPAANRTPPRAPGPRRAQDGFTLTELAVVVVIVAIMIGGMLIPLSMQEDLRRIQETQKRLNDIRDALLGFAAANGRLPCPASATIPGGTVGAGLEQVTGTSCTNPKGSGVLPWATLGVAEADAWGNRYSYRVTIEFARSIGLAPTSCVAPAAAGAAFALCSVGDLRITGAGGSAILADQVPVVVVAHGKNGHGAYTSSGVQIPNPTPADADEQDNQLTGGGVSTGNLSFVAKTPTSTFDDQTLWLSPAILFNRMIAAGRLP